MVCVARGVPEVLKVLENADLTRLGLLAGAAVSDVIVGFWSAAHVIDTVERALTLGILPTLALAVVLYMAFSKR